MPNFLRKLLKIQYATAKKIVPIFSKEQNGFSTAMASVLAALLVITTIVILAPFVLFRTCLYVILKARYRDSFGGFLNGIDRLFERSRPCICHCMVIYSCKSDESTRVKALERFIDQVHNSSWRYSCSIKKSCGYEYFVKNQVKSKDILEIVKGESNSMTKTMLHDYIESNGAKLKKEHMWKLTAFQQPIRCSETANMLDHQYVMIISIRHSAGDGPSILGSFKQFLDAENENNIGLDNSHSKVSWPEAGLSDAYVHRNPLIQKLEGRAMELTTHSRWHVGIFSEQDRKLVPLIKEIRKKLKVAFVEVIMAAFISSIDNYATKRNVKLDNITTYCTMRPQNRGAEEILNKRYCYEGPKNNFGIVTYNINYGTAARTMKDTILMVHNLSEMLKNSVDYMFFDVYSGSIFSYLPHSILKFVCSNWVDYATVCVTNLIGFGKSTYCGGSIDDMVLFLNDCNNIGYFLTAFTYDGRLGLTVSAGRGFVHNRKEVEGIVNNTVMYLHQAAKEILETSSTDMKY